MSFLKRLFGGCTIHSPAKHTQAQLEPAPTPPPPPAADQGGGDRSAKELLAEVSLIERHHAQLMASTAAAVQVGLAKVYAEVADPHGAFILGYVHGCGHAIAKVVSAGPLTDVAFVLALFMRVLGEKEGAVAWAASTRCFHASQIEWNAGHSRALAENRTPSYSTRLTNAGCTSPDNNTQLDANAYNNQGMAKAAIADFDGAIADFTQALALKPDYAVAFYNRGIAKKARGDIDGAIADYTTAIALKPDYAFTYNNRGNEKALIGDLDGAVADYTKAIALQPGCAEAYHWRGIARSMQRDWDGAIADFTQAIELKPDYAAAYYNRSNTKKAKGDLDGAIRDHSSAIEHNPDYAQANDIVGLAKIAKGVIILIKHE